MRHWAIGRRSRQRGFSLLELVIVGVVVLMLLGVLFVRYAYIQAEAERTARLTVLNILETTLTLKAGEVAFRQGAAAVSRLAGGNPFEWITNKPANYGGEVPLPFEPKSGTWYYAPRNMEVLYVWNWTEGVFPKPEFNAVERFKVRIQRGAVSAGSADGVSFQSLGVVDIKDLR